MGGIKVPQDYFIKKYRKAKLHAIVYGSFSIGLLIYILVKHV